LRLVKGSYECLKLTINRHTNTGKHRGCSFCTLMTEKRVVVTRISKLILNLGAVSGYAVWFKLVTIFICLIAIAYSMGQIIKSFCVCACVCVCVCVCPSVDTLTVAFLRRSSPNWTQTCKPTKVRTSSLGLWVNIAPPLLLFSP